MRISDWSSDVCSSDLAQAINDGSYNIFDPGATPVDVLNSIKATITRNSTFTTKEAYGNVTFNDLFEMGGGSAGLVVGGEFRKEQYADTYEIGRASCRERVCQYG